MPFAREDLDSNLVSMGEELLLMVGSSKREPQLQALAGKSGDDSEEEAAEDGGGRRRG